MIKSIYTTDSERDRYMKCPYCQHTDSRVIDSRPTEANEKIRRRRACAGCGRRFTTYETIETVPIVVVKKDKSRQVFDREKLLMGLLRACEKRPVTLETLQETVDDIENELLGGADREVTSVKIGELAMDRLQKLDEVAYVRFASVYRQFRDINSFMTELERLLDKKKQDEEE